jgi:alpha-1,2-mannosyltransferase
MHVRLYNDNSWDNSLNKDTMPSYLSSSCWIWTFIVLPIHVGYRIALANRMPIMDCDEVFNYWEVLYYLLFRDDDNKNTAAAAAAVDDSISGSLLGFQTWEYSNEFALRTYAYLTPLVFIARIYLQILRRSGILRSVLFPPSWFWSLLTDQIFDPSRSPKIALFVLLRSTLGAWMAYGEVSFCRAIVEQGEIETDDNNHHHHHHNHNRTTISEDNDDDKKKKKKNQTDGTTTSKTNTNYYMYTSLWFALVGWVTEFLLISSAGTAHSSAALLPSSTLMGLWLYAAAAFLRKQHGRFCVLAIMATLAIGWPFGVLVLVPLGIGVLVRELVERERLVTFVFLWIIPITTIVQGLVMLIDYQHYGRIVSPLWNILLYNTQAGGDELYGVEPLSYYIKNLVLNLNYVAVVGIAGILPLMWSLLEGFNFGRNNSINNINNNQISSSSSSTWKDGWILMVPLYLWLAVVARRPHKEERFLYPIYPSMCLGAAIVSVSIVQGLLNHPWWTTQSQQERKQQKMTSIIPLSVSLLAMIWIPAGIISWSRTIALSKYYSAPLLLYAQIPDAISKENLSLNVVEGSDSKSSITATVVCTCGEWYRFPSSFFIESADSSEVIFGFAPSTFTGQLPQPFTKQGSGPSSSSSSSSSSSTTNQFNDKNLPEPGSYTSLENCDFLVELSRSLHSCTEQGNNSNGDIIKWQPIVQVPFFDSETTTSTLHRILYVPHLHESAIQSGEVQYSDFVLYAKK